MGCVAPRSAGLCFSAFGPYVTLSSSCVRHTAGMTLRPRHGHKRGLGQACHGRAMPSGIMALPIRGGLQFSSLQASPLAHLEYYTKTRRLASCWSRSIARRVGPPGWSLGSMDLWSRPTGLPSSRGLLQLPAVTWPRAQPSWSLGTGIVSTHKLTFPPRTPAPTRTAVWWGLRLWLLFRRPMALWTCGATSTPMM